MSSRVTQQLMRICATRLDATVSAEEFIELLDTLVEWCVEAGRKQGSETSPPEAPGAAGDDDEDGLAPAPAPETGPGRRNTPAHIHRPKRAAGGGGGPKLSYDDKVLIRQEAAAAKEGNGGQQYPRGFIQGLAARYGVTDQTIYNAIKA